MRIAIAACIRLAAPWRSPTPPPAPAIPSPTTPSRSRTRPRASRAPGTLMAKIEVEQGGKSLGTFTCELFEKQAPKTVANFVGLARGLRPWKDPKTRRVGEEAALRRPRSSTA